MSKSKKKDQKIKIINIENDGVDIVIFKVEIDGKIIEDRCKISGIKNIVNKKINHQNAEIYSAILNSLGGLKDEAATNS